MARPPRADHRRGARDQRQSGREGVVDAEDEERRRIIARLEHALQRPDAFQLLVDRLPRANAILGLKIWGSLRGLYVETPPMPRASDTVPGAPGPVEEGDRA